MTAPKPLLPGLCAEPGFGAGWPGHATALESCYAEHCARSDSRNHGGRYTLSPEGQETPCPNPALAAASCGASAQHCCALSSQPSLQLGAAFPSPARSPPALPSCCGSWPRRALQPSGPLSLTRLFSHPNFMLSKSCHLLLFQHVPSKMEDRLRWHAVWAARSGAGSFSSGQGTVKGIRMKS